MAITLKIISYQRLTPGQQDSFQTDLERFSVGRKSSNDWALPDPQRFMSGTHCWLEKQNGDWLVKDTSTNGVFINGSDDRVGKNQSVVLKQGDRIRIGDYELEVSLEHSAAAASMPSDPFSNSSDPFMDDEDDPPVEPMQADTQTRGATPELKDVNTPLSQMDSNLLGNSVSIDDLFQLEDDEETPEPPPSLAGQGNQGSPLDQHFSAPRVAARDSTPSVPDKYAAPLDEIPDNWDDIPEDWDEDPESIIEAAPAPPDPTPLPDDHETAVGSHAVAPQVAEPAPEIASPKIASPAAQPETAAPVAPAAPRATNFKGDNAVAAFAAGAGLDYDLLKTVDQTRFFQDLGALVKTMTEGLMQAITARGQVKSEFRLEQTMIAPTENNPIKFSVSPQEAMMRLINHKDGAYLSGIAAAAEAVDDINAHQLAVMAGTEAALKSILRRFDPAKLEEKFGQDSALNKAMPTRKKARYWEFYKVIYSEISEAVDDDFQQLFGTEFSKAYEHQLERLKISRKESSK